MMGKDFAQFPTLITERLTLRPLRSSDDAEIFALRSNNNVNKYLDRKPSRSIDEARNFIQAINENIKNNDSIYWAIILNGTDKLIGTICLFNFSYDNLKVEIGYELLPSFQRTGIMREAVAEVTNFGIQHTRLHSVEAYTHPENQSSTRLLEKLKFKKQNTDDDNIWLFRLTPND